MDFINLNTELESLGQFSKQGLTTLNNLNSFFKTIFKYSDQFYSNSKKSLDTLSNELTKYDYNSILGATFSDFCINFEKFLKQLKALLGNVESEILEPISLFSKHLNGKYNECISDFKNIVSSTYDGKRKLEITKHKYFDTCKLAVEQEKYVVKLLNDREKNVSTDEEVSHAHDMLFKLRTQAEDNCHVYKHELAKTNKLFEENEKKYFPIIEKIKVNEESRGTFIKYHFEKFSKILDEFALNSCQLVSSLHSSIAEINLEQDLSLIEQKFNYRYKNNERIPREEFLNYDIYRRNLEKMLSNTQMMLGTKTSNSITTVIVNTSEEFSTNQFSSAGDNNITAITAKYTPHHEEEALADNFFTNINSNENEVLIDKLSKIINKLDGNITISKIFIDKLLPHYKSILYVKIPNYQNLHHFASVMNNIINNTDIKKGLFEINFAVMFVAEKTFYENPDNIFNKIYLCKLLSKNKIYEDKKFWMDLIELKINSLIEQKIQIEIAKREKERENLIVSNSQPGASPRNSKGGIMSKMRNLFTSTVMKENKKVESNIMYTQIYDQIKSSEAANVIKEYITHFSNFNFDVSEAIDVIVELSMKYNFERDKVNYFISVLNSNNFTIKNKMTRIVQQDHIGDYKNYYLSKPFNKYKSFNDPMISIFACSLKYLDIKDYPHVLILNKNFHSKLCRIVYKNVLFRYHNMKPEVRLKIWGSLLKISKVKRSISYEQTLKELEKQPENIQSSLEAIQLDVTRTPFDKNIEEGRKAIFNILKAVSFHLPNVNYCQGMNYIAAFLYTMTGSEKEAFYVFFSLLTTTEYGSIFSNDLERLKQFFYVFERLLFLYMPEIFQYLKNNAVYVSYYVAPWFITLFTTCRQYISESSIPKNGWKSIIKSSLCLIKHYERTLLQMKYEELLHFLINDIIKYEYFQNINYDHAINLAHNLKIPSGLVSNLENEYLIQLSLKEIDDKKKEDSSYKSEKDILLTI